MTAGRHDVVIVGGGVIGSAIACFLGTDGAFDGSVAVVERDPTYRCAATSLSVASIRTQFSNPLNVRISQFGAAFFAEFAERIAVGGDRPDLAFQPGGYLFLAATAAQEERLRANHAVQRGCGADVVLWEPAELAAAFPHLRTDDLRLASYGRSGEGWIDSTALHRGFRERARASGARFLADEVVAIERTRDRIATVRLASGGRIAAGTVVNASGARARLTAAMAGLDLPVEPRKRTVFVFDCARSPQGTAAVNGGRLPLMIDPSGVFCRPEGRYFIAGGTPRPDPAVDPDDFEPRDAEFETLVWPALAARAEAFEAIKVVNRWAGQYDFNTLDRNLIVGPHTEVPNFIFANGFSGHGLQQAPAVGRAVAELIVHGRYTTLDLSELGYERVIAGRPFPERAVI